MAGNDGEKKFWLPKIDFNKRKITKQMHKVEGATIKHTHKFIIKRWSSVRESQRSIFLWVLAMGILIAATGLQLMWFQQSYKESAPANDGTYVEAVLGPIDTLNPLFASSSAEQSVNELMFSHIFEYDKTGHLGYDLATNITINDTKTIYTVNILSNVKWHDGANLTANDIAFTIGLIKNPNIHSNITGWKDVAVKVINDTTIEFSLQSVYAAFEHLLTFPILPEHLLGNVAPNNILENEFSQNPVGSGPFKLRFIQDVNTKSSHKIIYMAKNEEYYNGSGNLSRFQLNVYNTNDEIIKALSNNEVNAAADLYPADLDSVNKKRYNVSSDSIQSGVYAIINLKSEILKDVTLRQALRLATNTKAIRDELTSSNLELDLPFVNGQLTGDIPKAPAFDLDSAKQILTDNGWVLNSDGIRQKDGKDLKISVVAIKNSEFERVLEILTGQWRSLGVTVETKVVDINDTSKNVIQTILQPRNFDVLLYQLNIGADPDVYVYWHSSQASLQGFNFSNYSNPISDDALLSARTRLEPELRNAKYITFAKQWLEDIPAIGLYQSSMQYVHSKNVNSFTNEPTVLVSPIDRYADISTWSVGTRSVYKTP